MLPLAGVLLVLERVLRASPGAGLAGAEPPPRARCRRACAASGGGVRTSRARRTADRSSPGHATRGHLAAARGGADRPLHHPGEHRGDRARAAGSRAWRRSPGSTGRRRSSISTWRCCSRALVRICQILLHRRDGRRRAGRSTSAGHALRRHRTLPSPSPRPRSRAPSPLDRLGRTSGGGRRRCSSTSDRRRVSFGSPSIVHHARRHHVSHPAFACPRLPRARCLLWRRRSQSRRRTTSSLPVNTASPSAGRTSLSAGTDTYVGQPKRDPGVRRHPVRRRSAWHAGEHAQPGLLASRLPGHGHRGQHHEQPVLPGAGVRRRHRQRPARRIRLPADPDSGRHVHLSHLRHHQRNADRPDGHVRADDVRLDRRFERRASFRSPCPQSPQIATKVDAVSQRAVVGACERTGSAQPRPPQTPRAAHRGRTTLAIIAIVVAVLLSAAQPGDRVAAPERHSVRGSRSLAGRGVARGGGSHSCCR